MNKSALFDHVKEALAFLSTNWYLKDKAKYLKQLVKAVEVNIFAYTSINAFPFNHEKKINQWE